MTGSGMRVKGEGFPEQVGNRYRWRVTIAGKVKVGPLCRTKTEARTAFLKKQEKQKRLQKERSEEENSQSFSTYVRNLNAAKEHKVAPSTAAGWQALASAIEKDPLGAMKPADICPPPPSDLPKGAKPPENAALADWRDRQKTGSETTKRRLAFICMRLRDLGYDPGRVDPPKKRARVRRPLKLDERKAVIDLIGTCSFEMQLALYLSWHMGLRRSEVCGLKHEDRQGDGVLIQRAVTIGKDAIHVRDFTKSPRGRRWIPLPPSLAHVIGKGKGFVLGDEKTPMNPRTLSANMRDLLLTTDLRAKVPYMGLHALRRTFGMILLESGTDLITAAELGGHDPTVLALEYAASREDLKTSAMDRAFGPTEQTA